MAQDEASESSSPSSSAAAGRLNAAAPEFTPRSAAHHQAHPHRRGPHHQQHHHHHQPHHQHQHQHRHQNHHGEDEGDAAGVVERDAQFVLPEELARRVVKQVEFYFSDVNLATTDHLMRFITKDPDGFVPMSVVASFRKIRELIDRSLLPAALSTSTELVVSDDGKMVRRRVPFSDMAAEEVQSRIIIADNLPDDHRYQTLMRIFSSVGSVKSIRTCYPQGIEISGPAAGKLSRVEMFFANKLHAFVEYETVEAAEKAVAEFSGGRNWRDGPRARSLLGCVKHGLGQGRKGGDDEAADEDDPDTRQEYEAEDMAQAEDGYYDKNGMGRGGRGRGRAGRGRGCSPYHGQSRDSGHPIGTPPSNHSAEHPVVPKPPPGPRMPDGTKGFTMGRGKPHLNPINAV